MADFSGLFGGVEHLGIHRIVKTQHVCLADDCDSKFMSILRMEFFIFYFSLLYSI